MSLTASLISFTSGGSLQWMSMSPELNPEKFGALNLRPTKESDSFALGMVFWRQIQLHPSQKPMGNSP